MHLMPLKPNSQRKRGADASLAAHLFMREDSSCTCSQINLRFFFVVVVYKARREERDRSTGVALVFLSRDLRLCRTPSSQPTLPPAKAPVIWIFLFDEGDFKREGGLSWSRERRKALSAGSPTMFGPYFYYDRTVSGAASQLLCLCSHSEFWGESPLRMPDIYFFECNWVFQLVQSPREFELLVLCPELL